MHSESKRLTQCMICKYTRCVISTPSWSFGETDSRGIITTSEGDTTMKPSALSLTALTALAIATSGNSFANDSSYGAEKYGSAPQSLDYPTKALPGASKYSMNEHLAMQQEELYFLTQENPFPQGDIPAFDPVTQKKVDRVLVGPAFKSRSSSGAEYYRYVTFYNITSRKIRIYELPILHEECHDASEIFGSYSYSHSYSASVHAGVSVEGLGLDGTFTDTRTFTTSRNLRATGGIIADHTPYFTKQDWSGETLIQTYSTKTGKATFLTQKRDGTLPWWSYMLSPIISMLLTTEPYPYAFDVKDADWTMTVERAITGKCDAKDSEVVVPDLDTNKALIRRQTVNKR